MKKAILVIIIVLIFIVILSVSYKFSDNKNINSRNILESDNNEELIMSSAEVNDVIEEDLDKKQQDYYENLKEQTIDKVSMAIKEDTLSKTGVTIVITDENKVKYSFVRDNYKLEKNIFGNFWIELPLKSDGYIIEPLGGHGANGITEMKIDWKERYGELKKGKYRIIMVKDKLYTEFNIK